MPNTPTLALPYPSPADDADVPADMQALALALDGGSFMAPIGSIFLWAVLNPPAKWLICNGNPIDPEYATLIGLIGPNTPDLRDKLPIGASATKPVRSSGGSDVLTEAQLPAHRHARGTLVVANHNHQGITQIADRDLSHLHIPVNPAQYVIASAGEVVTTATAAAGTTRIPVGVGPTILFGGHATTGVNDRSIDHRHGITAEAPQVNGDTADAGAGAAHVHSYVALNYIIRAG